MENVITEISTLENTVNFTDEALSCINDLDKIFNENNIKRRMVQDYEDDNKVLNAKVKFVEQEIVDIKKCIAILQQISDDRNEQGRKYIEDLINSALASVFPDRDYSIYIDEYTHGTRKHMKVYLSEGNIIRDLKYSHGTGVKQIISFIFNVALIVFRNSSRVLFLDETLASIHESKALVMSDLLVSLMEKNNFQFFIIDQKSNLFDNEKIIINHLKYDHERGTIVENVDSRGSKSGGDSTSDILEGNTSNCEGMFEDDEEDVSNIVINVPNEDLKTDGDVFILD